VEIATPTLTERAKDRPEGKREVATTVLAKEREGRK
jgi:hypothetical protein